MVIHPGHLTTKSDVYSFGVVLLEMMSARRAIDKNRPVGEHNLVEWARPLFSSRRRFLTRVMDPRLQGQYSNSGAQKAAALVVKCLSSQPKFRPTMEEVVQELEEILKDRDTARSTQGGSRIRRQAFRGHVKKERAANPRPS